jgi:hypothetical protein
MDPLACRDRTGSFPDRKTILGNSFTFRHGAQSDLVAGCDGLSGRNLDYFAVATNDHMVACLCLSKQRRDVVGCMYAERVSSPCAHKIP